MSADAEEKRRYEQAQRRYEAAMSPEYQAALRAQTEYDATPEGQRMLAAELETADPAAARGLRARATAGVSARRAWREQAGFMGAEDAAASDDAWRAMVALRHELGYQASLLAAQTEGFGDPPDISVGPVLALFDEVARLDREQRDPAEAETVDPLSYATRADLVAEWVDADLRQADPGDVPVLIALGLDVRWDVETSTVIVRGDLDAAHRWGYATGATRADGSTEVVLAPCIDVHFARSNRSTA
ncbi:hypothetical protein J1G42_05500 [Cellulomonas sp. zg-ZUI222]|uniref:Uncharacterized protein n=1 Tax=Cellulomonas wangleii TaxID=2816956 RepID=A0ABX8D2G6_9CELL|nr:MULTISPECIES: hypothetical protein [Cellulomonas]MBO0899426.1 hypothetical protein [Cellulomonas sp. zg-ZUI22]MBO0920277.1 hypothetical protein [Cellulomonas wangleii]MBO0923291.1 hypothetical protein [Cellulomonas wangleii]QVI61650.1 hypothetical protein KG103_14470 [Cellulomonas wangleii]